MPRPARTTDPTPPTNGDLLRTLLGCTQQEWALTIGTEAGRVAGVEAGRRSLPPEATACDLLLGLFSLPLRRLVPVVEPLPVAPAVVALPLPAPAGLRRPTAERRLAEVAHHAHGLRYTLGLRQRQYVVLAHIQGFRRAFLAALAAPPAPAVEYRNAFSADQAADIDARVERLRAWLTDRLRQDDLPGGPLDPTSLALDQLRLLLLDTEAATLAAWLAPAAPG